VSEAHPLTQYISKVQCADLGPDPRETSVLTVFLLQKHLENVATNGRQKIDSWSQIFTEFILRNANCLIGDIKMKTRSISPPKILPECSVFVRRLLRTRIKKFSDRSLQWCACLLSPQWWRCFTQHIVRDKFLDAFKTRSPWFRA
jgi:hypothetical protein